MMSGYDPCTVSLSARLNHPLQQGVFPALWIPTDAQGELMESDFRELIQHGLQHGVDGFMVLGTTGEFPHLELSTRRRVIEVARLASGGLPIMVNVSDIRPKVVAELGRFCRQQQVDAISLLPPWYFRLSQSDLLEFFLRSADAAGLPTFLYNFPERVGYKLELETIAAFADRMPLLGVKQSGSDFSYHSELVKLGGEKGFVVLTGSDTALPEAMELGVTGVVSGLSNAIADCVVAAFRALRGGRPASGISEVQWLTEISQRLGRMEFPFNVGAVLRARGMPVGHPKMWVSAQSQIEYDQLTDELRQLFKQWKLV